MRLKRRARYALMMMVEIAKWSSGNRKVSLSSVSKKTQISRRYLEQLAMALKSASLVRGMTGKGGGYMLARPAEEISIGQIVEAAIGPIYIVECVEHSRLCLQAHFCGCRKIYELINKGIQSVLDTYTLADLASMSPEAGSSPRKKERGTIYGCAMG